ncbi:beta-ketoacyl synthase N-terminal-like domain-containing protein [Nocardia sp. NPDC059177]|uniref:beta-ketoacyl synthase N-terminal-like domain-containing protein n=1 Tax=Nocardia sp. NPDC059177 TaxID=3346759 RepID=UPI00369D46C0
MTEIVTTSVVPAVRIHGFGILTPAGTGIEPLSELVSSSGDPQVGESATPDLYPPIGVRTVPDFEPREHLGRKGIGSLDRTTTLALVAAKFALDTIGGAVPEGFVGGMVVGTTTGSLPAMFEYCRDTIVEDRPYLVNPIKFPNTIMNSAAGQTAIRWGLEGVNATVAGGRVAAFQALRYAANSLRQDRADVMLVGAAEEASAYRAWTQPVEDRDTPGFAIGEAAAMFVASLPGHADIDLPVLGDVLAVRVRSAASDESVADDLARCIAEVLAEAQLPVDAVHLHTPGLTDESTHAAAERAAVAASAGGAVETIAIDRFVGMCGAAHGAIQLAVTLDRLAQAPAGAVGLLTGVTTDGLVAAALVRLVSDQQ